MELFLLTTGLFFYLYWLERGKNTLLKNKLDQLEEEADLRNNPIPPEDFRSKYEKEDFHAISKSSGRKLRRIEKISKSKKYSS